MAWRSAVLEFVKAQTGELLNSCSCNVCHLTWEDCLAICLDLPPLGRLIQTRGTLMMELMLEHRTWLVFHAWHV